uniref:Putative ovule protein n=1 Tax=Solanum chacoense TaxID=4108 RepID=A0A0V0HJ42_SOLCH
MQHLILNMFEKLFIAYLTFLILSCVSLLEFSLVTLISEVFQLILRTWDNGFLFSLSVVQLDLSLGFVTSLQQS